MTFSMACSAEIRAQINDEYETPRTGAEQKAWMEEIGYKIKACAGTHEDYRLRKPPYKRYVEEALPIAYFTGESAEFKAAEVTLRMGNQSFDAEVTVGGTTEYIEVVNAEDGHLFNLKAKLLNKFGVAPGTLSKGIPFLKKLLESDKTPTWFGDVIHGIEEFQTMQKRLSSAIDKKIKHGYSGSYHLLACFELDAQFDELSELADHLKTQFGGQTTFASITLFERRSASLIQVLP